jgi:hypothetical protein
LTGFQTEAGGRTQKRIVVMQETAGSAQKRALIIN